MAQLCQLTFNNLFGKIALAFTQLRSEHDMERALSAFHCTSIEGVAAPWHPQILLVLALLNEKTRSLAAEKLKIALKSEIFTQLDEFPAILAPEDLGEEFCFDGIVVVKQGRWPFEALMDADAAQLLAYDDNAQFVASGHYAAFADLFERIESIERPQIFALRRALLALLCQKAVLSTFQINFTDAAPTILIHVILRFLQNSLSEDVPLDCTLMFHLMQFAPAFSLFFSDDSAIRGTAAAILLQEVRNFADMPAVIHSALSPQQAAFLLETSHAQQKLDQFYRIEDSVSAVALALTLEKVLNLENFA